MIILLWPLLSNPTKPKNLLDSPQESEARPWADYFPGPQLSSEIEKTEIGADLTNFMGSIQFKTIPKICS